MRSISVGIDIGSKTTKVVVAEFVKGEKNPKILAVGESHNKGMRDGYVISSHEAILSLKNALAQAEKICEIKIRRGVLALSGATLRGDVVMGSAIISKADGEITNLDINKALSEAENSANLTNRKVVQVSPVAFKLDGKEILGRPHGMHGNKLEVKALVISCSEQHLDDILEVAIKSGVEIVDVIPSAISASEYALSAKQKQVGVMLVNIGGETTSLVVYENGTIVSLYTFPIGGEDITNDIALGLKVSLEDAEKIKTGEIAGSISKRKVDEIIEARLADIFETIDNHLKKIKRSELLPAGVFFVGGTANIAGLEELSKDYLRLPSRIGSTEIFGNIKTKLRDPSWLPVIGLINNEKNHTGFDDNKANNIFKELKQTIRSLTRQLMP